MNTGRKFFASVMAAVLLTMSMAVEGQSQPGHPTKKAIEGSWRQTGNLGPNRPPNVPEVVELLVTYAEGGGLVFTDNLEAKSGHGSWEFAERGQFNVTYDLFLFDPDGHYFATLHVRSKITLDATQDAYTTEEVAEIRLFPSGDVIFAYTGITAVGTRIVVEPIE